MDLLQQLQEAVWQYLDRKVGLDSLRAELADLAIPIADGGDAEASALAGLIWRLVGEYDYGDRTEPNLRKVLFNAMPMRGLRIQATRTTARTPFMVTSYLATPRFQSHVSGRVVA